MRQVSRASLSPALLSPGNGWIASAAARSSSSPSINCEIRSFIKPLPPFVLTGPQQRPELLRNRLARPEDSRPDRADRAIHRFRDVFVAHALDLTHLDRGAQLFGQLLDRGVHRRRDLVRQEHALWRVDVAQLLALFKPFGLFGLSLGRGRRPPTHGHEIVLGRINSNPVQPRVKRAVATKCGKRPAGLDERFPRYIFDLCRVAYEARKQPRQLALVLLHQQPEGQLVAALRPRYELPV